MKKNRRVRTPHAGRRTAGGAKHAGSATAAAVRQSGQRADATAGSVPLARINAIVREIGPLLAGAAESLRAAEDRHRAALGAGAAAWAERESLLHRYYSFARSILQVRDDCAAGHADSPGMNAVRAGLDRALAEQRIEELPVRAGDPFDPRIHECESAAEAGEESGGAVVAEVLRTCFVQRGQGDAGIVIRPAKVLVRHDGNEGDDT
jgi:hypothetical protein